MAGLRSTISLIVSNGFRSHMGGGQRSWWKQLEAGFCSGHSKNPQRRFSFMKRSLLIMAAFTLASSMAWAQDGAALYKSKCAMCHGAAGEGKAGPALAGTKLTAAQITDVLTKGAEGK